MKEKFNLISDTFTHLTGGNKGYSVHGKESKYIEWVKDGSGEATFYIDSTLAQAEIDDIPGPRAASGDRSPGLGCSPRSRVHTCARWP